MSETHGLLLPPDVIQPFLLRFSRDDLHIMATFSGHPDYEAVEAMIRFRADGSPSIRAIITRHDQTQIDHVNDAQLLAQARGVARLTCHHQIDLDVLPQGMRRQARLAFTSHAGEQIVLDITAVGTPSAERGGLSNPGRHSPNSSLPLMWRGASTLAGPQTSVTIDGTSYDVPVRISSPHFTAHDGYYTERHTMAVIRAGTIITVLRHRPARIEAGAEWIFENADGAIRYRIARGDHDGRLVIESGNGDEVIVARAIGDRLDVSSIRHLAGDPLQPGFELTFAENDRFSLSVDLARDIITGHFKVAERADGARICLTPVQPAWAAARNVEVQFSRAGDKLVQLTSVGNSAGPAHGSMCTA